MLVVAVVQGPRQNELEPEAASSHIRPREHFIHKTPNTFTTEWLFWFGMCPVCQTIRSHCGESFRTNELKFV